MFILDTQDPNLMTGQERLTAICALLADAIKRKLEREAKQAQSQLESKLARVATTPTPDIPRIETQVPGWIVPFNIKYYYTIKGI